MAERESIEWCDIYVTNVNTEALPRVLLIGDSICLNYCGQVTRDLAGKYACGHLATSFSICAAAYEKHLAFVLDQYRFAVIHFNNGLHGWEYDEEAYAKSLPRVLDFMARRSSGSKLIWASSTPFRKKGALNEFDAETIDRLRERNRIAGEIVASRGIPIDDLFSLVEDHPEFYSEDACHFNPVGQEVLGHRVAESIRAVVSKHQ